MFLTLVASSTLVSYSTNLTSSGSTISRRRTVFQSRPWNLESPPFVGGLLRSSCRACCVREGWRDARGDVGAPRICSAKLERCDECGLGAEPILRAGGALRPMDEVELLREAFLVSALWLRSVMVATPACRVWRIAYFGMRGSAAGVKSYVGVEQRVICRQVCMCSGHGDTSVRRQVIGCSTTESPHVKRNQSGRGTLARSCNARSCYLLSPAAGGMRGCHSTLQKC